MLFSKLFYKVYSYIFLMLSLFISNNFIYLFTYFYFRKATSDSSGEDCLKALQFVRYNLTLAAVKSSIFAEDLRRDPLQGRGNQKKLFQGGERAHQWRDSLYGWRKLF